MSDNRAGEANGVETTVPRRKRERTRAQLVDTAFRVFWEQGYDRVALDSVIEASNFTKGAFYYHFPSKRELIAAVVDEAIAGMIHSRWIEPLQGAADPLEALCQLLLRHAREGSEEGLRNGCPLNNLSHELSALDEGLRGKADLLFQQWIEAIADALRRSRRLGIIAKGHRTDALATFVVAAFEGAFSLAKASRDRRALVKSIEVLVTFLRGLRSDR